MSFFMPFFIKNTIWLCEHFRCFRCGPHNAARGGSDGSALRDSGAIVQGLGEIAIQIAGKNKFGCAGVIRTAEFYRIIAGRIRITDS